MTRPAGALFERALRYQPEDLDATVGLARSLRSAGRSDRALALLERALRLVPEHQSPPGELLVELARLLATQARDLPQAIARVREVPASSSCVQEARLLEARWRASLGDIAGASIAFGRLREIVALAAHKTDSAPRWLLEAGRFELEVCQDLLASERHLALALRLSPQDEQIGELFRRVAAALAIRRREGSLAEAGVESPLTDESAATGGAGPETKC
jgi:tetratricopeptide (TPR) repeat protein